MKNILFIGSESYDAPTITVIEGLHKLGWSIYTIDKPNINSWFCNTVVSRHSSLPDFNFVLSNLHWGTRWGLYNDLGLSSNLKVLIDGDDNPNIGCWRDKYNWHCSRYKLDPPDYIKNEVLAPFRWMERMDNYKPDIVFCSQKNFDDTESTYLPFGIHDQYYQITPSIKKEYLFTHFPGPGKYRQYTKNIFEILKYSYLVNTNIWNTVSRGKEIINQNIKYFIENDQNIHSWHRWVMHQEYFDKLSKTKILIYPGVDMYPFWDSKRPWEAIACGAAVLMRNPTIETKEYSICDIDRDFVYASEWELIKKISYFKNLNNLDEKIYNFVYTARNKFSSIEIAKYFLKKIGQCI